MRTVDVRGADADADGDEVQFKWGDDDYVRLSASRSISVLDSKGHYVYVENYEVDDLIKALQMAKKEYFGG